MDAYETAHQSAAFIDRSTRGTLLLTGADRASFLQGLLTNDISGLAAGQGCYAAWLTPQGRMITDMLVIVLEDRILLDVPAFQASSLARRLEALVFSEDVQVQDVSGILRQVRVVGPAAPETVEDALAHTTSGTVLREEDLADWVEYQNAAFHNGELVVVRDDELGVIGYDIHVADSVADPKVSDFLKWAGTPELDDDTAETLRIEAGRPLFGVDMDTDTIPLEAGIEDRAISFSKGCYVGQEIIVRVTSRGHGRVARKLVGLVLEGARVPARGEAIFTGDREIGRVTSATRSPALGRPIALAYVHRDFVEPATQVTVGSESHDSAVIAKLPFVRSQSAAR